MRFKACGGGRSLRISDQEFMPHPPAARPGACRNRRERFTLKLVRDEHFPLCCRELGQRALQLDHEHASRAGGIRAGPVPFAEAVENAVARNLKEPGTEMFDRFGQAAGQDQFANTSWRMSSASAFSCTRAWPKRQRRVRSRPYVSASRRF